ncbi:hypothetical protein N7491_008993 [Penicillium cf. griseofulvum]|uniref:Uncharacterized protein n=1 Tax=Penicillium cf. griseofulvum TaxID=2972120 RepID=A0A9W9JPL4_9EURO|nr:hypothetical protein N7472_005411 [Penicillium cf. griseofulvum]KAJ5423777.1 hypothetical protein N7491_008993 [Penicillium cf. griseofulvum]KAJ5430970.1 hypothetical protein N7445_008702 [Penicillium cf. griseofulvum]
MPPDTSPGGYDLAMESGPSQVDITSRLSIVLDAVQKAGFQDFEAMVEAYYTANLERNSFPALLQCASRRRRLKPMLHNLQDSSRQWPRWESRGINESISTGTASLCVEEIVSLDKRKLITPNQTQLASLIDTLESLLWCHKCIKQGNCKSHPLNSIAELELLGQLEAAPDSVSRPETGKAQPHILD